MAEAKGILGTKLGMTQIFTEDSRAVPVTVIQAGPCVVTQVKTLQRDGYEAVQLAYAEMPRGKANKPDGGSLRPRPGRSRTATWSSCGPTGRRPSSRARRSRPTSSRPASTPTWSACRRATGSRAR